MQLPQCAKAGRGRADVTELKLTNKLLLKHMLKTLGSKTMYQMDWLRLSQLNYQKFDQLLKQLLIKGYVVRVKRGVYQVTAEGKKWLEMEEIVR